MSMRDGERVLALAVLITVPALLLARLVGSDFMPPLDEGALFLRTMLPQALPSEAPPTGY